MPELSWRKSEYASATIGGNGEDMTTDGAAALRRMAEIKLFAGGSPYMSMEGAGVHRLSEDEGERRTPTRPSLSSYRSSQLLVVEAGACPALIALLVAISCVELIRDGLRAHRSRWHRRGK